MPQQAGADDGAGAAVHGRNGRVRGKALPSQLACQQRLKRQPCQAQCSSGLKSMLGL